MSGVKLQRGAFFGVVVTVGLLSGCGLEGLINLHLGNQYEQNVNTVAGTLPFPGAEFYFVDSAGERTAAFASRVDGGYYEADFIAGGYSGVKLQAIQGQGVVEAFIQDMEFEERREGVELSPASTARVKLLEGALGPEGKQLSMLSDDEVCIAGKRVDQRIADGSGPQAELVAMMTTITNKANLGVTTTTQTFQVPRVSVDAGTLVVDKSALNVDWVLRASTDYTGDGVLDQTTEAFDQVFLAALEPLIGMDPPLFSAPPDPDNIRVVFAVDFNNGKLDGVCKQINRFKWVRDEPGKQMYFVGGIHKTSPIQDPRIDAMLGNRGGWTPNQIRMYDDGTHGDRTAGDNVWTITFDLPRGLRMGYKYTWGRQGDLWTGTEEWPGNQRILIVEDVNGDGYVYRADDFGDEATNKDVANGNPASKGALDWDEDLNGDGFPEAGETPVDTNNDCVAEGFVTPDWVPALTITCDEYVGQ